MPRLTSKIPKRLRFALGALLGLAALGIAVGVFIATRFSQSQLDAAASKASGMQVTTGGGLKVRLFPSFGVTLQDVRIRNQGADLAAAQQMRLGIELLPLVHGELRITAIGLAHVTLAVEQGVDGKFNFEGPSSAAGTLPVIDATDVSIADVTLLYTDKQNGNTWRAGPCDVEASHFQMPATTRAELSNSLLITATVSCKQIQTRKLTVADVKFTLDAKQGLFAFTRITMRAYDGQGSGEVHANLSGGVPTYHVHYVLSKFRIEELWTAFSQKKIGEGLMDFSTDLTLRGYTVIAMTQSSVGEASLHGDNLILATGDLDRELSRYESTQKFDLVDVGAVLVAGPLGLAVTKGYDYARLLGTSGGSSPISKLISEWRIENGIAEAKDVAMTTKANRLAMKGKLDFVHDQFQDVTLALVNEQGCVRVQQNVHGPFSKPDVDKPNVVGSLTGPVRRLLNKAKHLMGGRCEPFYTGSLAPPQ